EDGIRDGHVTGVQTCALPISLAGLQRTPVIVVSGQTEALLDKVAMLADGVMRKPVDMAELIEKVRQALGREPVGLAPALGCQLRSEERRVGKEWRSGGVTVY